MSLEDGIIKKSEMDKDTGYILCPDKNCSVFAVEKNPLYHCQYECPKKNEQVKIFLCKECGEPIEVPIDYESFRRFTGHTCADGKTIMSFVPFNSQKIYERPK